MEANYVFPAKLKKQDSLISLEFIDFDIYVEEENMELLVSTAQDELALTLIDMLDRGEELPQPTMDWNGDGGENEIFINVWLPYYRTKIKEVYVRKNVTIPQWLDILAEEKGINFSAALVEGVKSKLGI